MAIEKRKWDELLMTIMEGLVRLEVGLAGIGCEMGRLEMMGIYPAVPSESWEARNGGEARYLRMVFPKGSLAGGRRKIYVGCDPARVEAARGKATRRGAWELLDRERGRLERHLRAIRGQLERVAGNVASYRMPEELGIELDVGPGAPVTKLGTVKTDIVHGSVTKCPDCGATIPGDEGCPYCENEPDDLVTPWRDHLEDSVTNGGEGLRHTRKVEYNVEGESGG